MKQIRLKNTTDHLFEEAWELYELSFPLEERRPKDAQVRVMKNPDYHFEIVTDKDELIGFVLWWDFEAIRFLEHFATSEKQRNKGYGSGILNSFISNNDKPIILEVELPYSEINKRRIAFYQRLGFKLNQHHYEFPPMHEGHTPLQLLLMTYPDFITEDDVAEFIEKYHPVILD